MSHFVTERQTLHRGRVFELTHEKVALENGHTAEMDLIRHPGATAIVPFIGPQTILLLHQYRHARAETIWEIPAGTRVPSESQLACAQRELIEETGYRAEYWEALGTILPAPGYSDEEIHLFRADGLKAARQHLDADEILELVATPFAQALQMVQAGQITDAKTIAALFFIATRA